MGALVKGIRAGRTAPARGRAIRYVAQGLAISGAITLSAVASAQAFVYYGDTNHYSIGRANLDGTDLRDAFAPIGPVFQVSPCGVAVASGYLYWGNEIGGTIGRIPIAGGNADTSFITGVNEPCGLAIYGNHLYWVNQNQYGSIGRASLSGARDIRQNFVPSEQAVKGDDLDRPCGVAVDQTGIYWSDAGGGSVGHASLDGTGARTLITGQGGACGVALGGGYVYWAHGSAGLQGEIGRALESGANPEPSYIAGLHGPCGVAVYSNYLFFADNTTIDRADLTNPNPTSSTQQIISGANNACGVAVDGLFAGHLTATQRHSGRHATAALTVRVSDPGTVTVRQPGQAPLVKSVHETAHRAGNVTITVRPTSVALRLLSKRWSVKVRIEVDYLPVGGILSTTSTIVTLKRG